MDRGVGRLLTERRFPNAIPLRKPLGRKGKITTRLDNGNYYVDFGRGEAELAVRIGRSVLRPHDVVRGWLNAEGNVWRIKRDRLAIADVYFLADNTGSMGPTITQVQADAAALFDQLNALIEDSRYGGGHYRDFTFDNPVFANTSPIPALDDGGLAASAAISAWSASGGADTAESWFYALHRLAVHDAAAFRSNATKFVVLLGDAPSHDPICSAVTASVAGHFDVHDITEASLTAELQEAGIILIAISVPSGPGLDGDPVFHGGDYLAYCGAAGGTPGQATRIAAATEGSYFPIVDLDAIVAAIIAGVEGSE